MKSSDTHSKKTNKSFSLGTKERKSNFFASPGVNSFFQPKLQINEPNDVFELEADAVAEKVMKPETSKNQPFFIPQPLSIQSINTSKINTPDKEELQKKEDNQEEENIVSRKTNDDTDDSTKSEKTNPEIKVDKEKSSYSVSRKCAKCEEEESVQRKEESEGTKNETSPINLEGKASEKALGNPNIFRACAKCEEEEEKNKIQRLSDQPPSYEVPESVSQTLKSSGMPLEEPIKNFMESRIGYDFSNVQIHNDSLAHQSSKDINALAYTNQNHIAFGAGQYQPDTDTGKRLIAHELTHVVQQNSGIKTKSIQRKPVDETERYPGEIEYKIAKSKNLETWYNYYKFFNLFKEEEIYPGSTPNKYANYVYELQVNLSNYLGADWKGGLPNGILEKDINNSHTLNGIIKVSQDHSKDPGKTAGISTDKLERILKIHSSYETSVKELTSEYLTNDFQLGLVISNPFFTVQYDDRGDYVKRLQYALLALNYDLGEDYKAPKGTVEKKVTGVFGKGTKKALENFQRDSGFEGKEVDGVLGQITLQLMDSRLSTSYYKDKLYSTHKGNAYQFSIPVSGQMLPTDATTAEQVKNDLLKKTLLTAFPITSDQAETLIESGWNWSMYKDVSQEEVARGYKIILIPKNAYESVIGKTNIGSGVTTSEETVSEAIEREAVELMGTSDLYELNKEIASLKKTISSIRTMTGHGRMMDVNEYNIERKKKLQEKLKGLEEKRDIELAKLNISLDEYNNKKASFVKTFEKFAAQTAFQMLAENEMKANIEFQHYNNLDSVKALKASVEDMRISFEEAEKEFLKGVSFAENKDENHYKSETHYKNENAIEIRNGYSFAAAELQLKSYRKNNLAKRSETNPFFASYYDKEVEAILLLQEKAKKFPILAHPQLELRKNASTLVNMPDETLKNKIQKLISNKDDDDGVLEKVSRTRDRIREDISLIWEMPPVVARAKMELGILENSVLDKIIMDAFKAKKESDFWSSLAKAALGIGLGLLALASGPVGWVALGASIAVGVHEAYSTYQDITMKREASGSAIEEVDALSSENPSYFWFVVSLVSIGLDVFAAVKIVKTLKKGAELADEVSKALKLEKATAEEALKKAANAKEATKLRSQISRLEEAISKADGSGSEYAKNLKLLEALKGNPHAVRFMSEALKDPKIVKAFTKLSSLVEHNISKEVFEGVMAFYAGIGKKAINELPELVRLVEAGGIHKNPTLFKALLQDTRLQKVLLDTHDAELFLREYKTWEELIKGGKAISFVEHLRSTTGISTKFNKGVTLAETFGEAFLKLPARVKNTQIVRMTEPRLLNEFNAGKLPPSVQRAMEIMLQRDILGLTTDFARAQERIMREVSIAAQAIELQSDFIRVVNLLNNPTTRKALWEGASKLIGRDEYLSLLQKVAADKGVAISSDIMDDLIRIGPLTDPDTVKRLISEKEFRTALVLNPEAVLVLKKCASPCFPPGATGQQVQEISALIKGRTSQDLQKIAEYIYKNRGDQQTLQTAIDRLKSNFDDVMKEVVIPQVKVPAKASTLSPQTLSRLAELGLPTSQLNNILAAAERFKIGGIDDLVYNLMAVLELEKKLSLNNFGKILQGLESKDKSVFRAARHLIEEGSQFRTASSLDTGIFKFPGLEKANKLLDTFTLSELHLIMSGSRWEGSFVGLLHDVTSKTNLPKSAIMELVNKAGTGSKGDLGRLAEIIGSMEVKVFTKDDIAKAITKSNEFASKIKAAMADPEHGFEKVAKEVWGDSAVVKLDETIEVAGHFKAGVKGSGEAAFDQVVRLGKRGDTLASSVVIGGKIDLARWEVLKKVINNTNISTGIKNNIIGELWTRANLIKLEADGYKVLKEVLITDGKTVAKADLVAIKDGELIIIECKSMAGTLSDQQKVIYPILENGNFNQVRIENNPILDAMLKNPKTKKSYQLLRDTGQ